VQPTEIQVQQSLRALESSDAAVWLGLPDESDRDDAPAVAELVEMLADAPAIRPERLVDARMRLAAGVQPTDDDLAGRMVGRLVCDRLR
jgi:hypothetical protein